MRRCLQFITYELGLWFIGLITSWMPEITFTCKLRGFLSRPFFGKCGRNFQYGKDVRFLAPWNIFIGNDVYVAGGCRLSGGARLDIEDEVMFGFYSLVATGSHLFKDGSARFGGFERHPVKVGRGSWVAGNVIITPGVVIGRGNLICGGAVVTKSTPDNVMVGGVPAKVIGPTKQAG